MSLHGGDVWQVAAEAGLPVSELLDFSANINPRGLPPRALERVARDAANPRLLGLYPDPSARSLRIALSRHLSVPPEAIVVGPGAEALLDPTLRSYSTQRALVPIPAFGEYRRVCEQQGMEFVPYRLDRAKCFRLPTEDFRRAIQTRRPGLIILNNPHNPSGAGLPVEAIRGIVDTAHGAGAAVLLDEAYIDYGPSATLISDAAGKPGLVVIRSLTKFYGCPALRAGYAVAHPETARRIASFLPIWAVTQLAMDVFAEALEDGEHAARSLRENAAHREELAQSLQQIGLLVFPSAANFLFLELAPGMPPASELRRRLIQRHSLLIRNCDSYEGLAPGRYIRVAVRSAVENRCLVKALAEELGSQ